MIRALEGRKGSRLPAWAEDVLLCQKLHWSYDDVQDAPEWFVQRALLLFDAMASVEAEQGK